ncbi:MAG: hypothetical protein IT344_06840 [Candidatus Dadabacteria bacterium]|nr:hypothetical protein [Candidatus Dadabacteria bacterium]
MIEVLTGLLVFITGLYALFTYKILKANQSVVTEMQNQNEALRRPYIVISPALFPNNIIFFLRIRNTGLTAAENLRLSLDKNFYEFGKIEDRCNLKSFKAFNDPIDSFVPGAEMTFYLAQSFVVFGENANPEVTPSIFTITAEYSFGKKTVVEKTVIDLRPYAHSSPPQDSISYELKKIREILAKK